MNPRIVANAMCKVTDEVLWKPRRGWATKHNPTADLDFRVGSGKHTYLKHRRVTANDASMTITYGKQMVVSKSDPETMCNWLTSRELHERRYYGGELTLLNILAHTVAHEFGHFVQVILGRRYDGSVHNQEFYVILDRIHASGEGDKIRAALHDQCMKFNIDLRQIRASQEGLNKLSGLLSTGEKPLSMREIHKGQQLWFREPSLKHFGPVKVLDKRRTRILIQQVAAPHQKWLYYPAAMSKTPA